jgi:hypothetical protein
VEDAPPATLVGLNVKDETVGAVRVNVAVLETELKVPVMVALVLDATAVVVIVKVPVVAPAAMVTLAGTVAEVELLDSVTTRPPVGAAEPMVAVPVLELPPATLVGETVSPVKAGGVIVNVAVAEVLLAVAVIVSVVLVATAVVVTVNVPVVAPAAKVTEVGRDVALLVSERVTTRPPVGATLERVTVPVEEDPPTTLVGLTESAVTVGAVMVRPAVLEAEL